MLATTNVWVNPDRANDQPSGKGHLRSRVQPLVRRSLGSVRGRTSPSTLTQVYPSASTAARFSIGRTSVESHGSHGFSPIAVERILARIIRADLCHLWPRLIACSAPRRTDPSRMAEIGNVEERRVQRGRDRIFLQQKSCVNRTVATLEKIIPSRAGISAN